VNEAPDVRVLAPASQAIYIDFSGEEHGFGLTRLPGLPSLKGADGTYSFHSTFANEFFFQCEDVEMPWEAALDSRGCGLVEASTRRLKYRKLFCWGQHTGGRHWQEYLSQPGQAYLEIQAGLAPTQVHGLVMPAQTAWDWTQAFGYLAADPAGAHSSDWDHAVRTVEATLQASLPAAELYRLEQTCRARADIPSQQLLQAGSGWGALELKRRGKSQEAFDLPPAFNFPAATLGPEQEKWLGVLEGKGFPNQDPADLPGEWLVQPEWQVLLQECLRDESRRNWYALLHLGVMRLENLDEDGAAAAWEESLRLQPSAWAYRNLAVLRQRQKRAAEALELYAKAWRLASQVESLQSALAAEYLQLLFDNRQYPQGLEICRSLPSAVQQTDPVQLLQAQFALELGRLELVEPVFEWQFAVIREGQTLLSD
jgi:hypothetical protein